MGMKKYGRYNNGNIYIESDNAQVKYRNTGDTDLPIEVYELYLKERELDILETNYDYITEQKQDELNLKEQEIEAIKENTKAQKELAETVLSAMTYLAQLLKQNP